MGTSIGTLYHKDQIDMKQAIKKDRREAPVYKARSLRSPYASTKHSSGPTNKYSLALLRFYMINSSRAVSLGWKRRFLTILCWDYNPHPLYCRRLIVNLVIPRPGN